MATKVHMEALSPTMEEGQLVRWLKNEGDEVADGDVLAEIETDKATMELVARGSGVLRKRLIGEGDTAPVGSVIGVIAAEDEDISGLVEDTAQSETAARPAAEEKEGKEAAEATVEGDGDEAEAGAAVAAAEKTEEPRAAAGVDAAAGTARRPATPEPSAPAGGRAEGGNGAAGEGRIKASPLARRLADEAGLELRQVEGTGPGGRITKRDIEAALERGVTPSGRGPAPAPGVDGPRFAQPVYEGPETEEVPVTQMRKTIAKRLVTSIGPVPTFYLTVDVDMTRMLDARERMNAALDEQGLKISLNDLLIKATALALKRHPEVNAAWHDDHVKRHHRVHIGVAVAVEEGLITPVVRDADLKGAAHIGTEVRELAGRARERKLKPEEYTGATFSISNLGMFGIEEFTAIINPPEAAILAVGAVEERVVVEDGEGVIAPRMKMTMSCDHRVIDGAMGARFLQTLRGFLEEPGMVLV
ncbi:MAG TPA: pyruvate dehydrogenase complex dihydrolipoamide acetyltransferase [Gemmatimonadota bacterium]|nr:pyruvate dehydrogenase complex dihydrolipoamide acetyltransferase [Gemmatimonadota bacterium]